MSTFTAIKSRCKGNNHKTERRFEAAKPKRSHLNIMRLLENSQRRTKRSVLTMCVRNTQLGGRERE